MNSNSPSSACPDIGVWRAWLDRENEPMLLEEHLVDCPGCRRLVALLQEDVAQVRAAFAMLAPDEASLPSTADVAVTRERLEWQRRRALPSLPRVGAQAPMALLLTLLPMLKRWPRWSMALLRVLLVGTAAAVAVLLAEWAEPLTFD